MYRALPILLLLPLYSTAASLTCDSALGGYFPRDTVYDQTTTVTHTGSSSTPLYPVFAIFVSGASPSFTCDAANCTIVQATVTDNRGTKYSTPVATTGFGGAIYRTSTPAPVGAVVSMNARYRVTPADGRTLHGNALRMTGRLDDATSVVINGTIPPDIPSLPNYGTTSYQAPDQHDYGQVSSTNPNGLPLTLLPPQLGSLLATILWTGPTGTTMTGTIGTTTNVPIPMGVSTRMDTAGQGLQVELRTSETATPGPITGNLTLTLTCP